MADDGLSVMAAPDASFLLRVTKEANKKKAAVKRMFADFDPSKCPHQLPVAYIVYDNRENGADAVEGF